MQISDSAELCSVFFSLLLPFSFEISELRLPTLTMGRKWNECRNVGDLSAMQNERKTVFRLDSQRGSGRNLIHCDNKRERVLECRWARCRCGSIESRLWLAREEELPRLLI